jgi:hypothetical protein
MKIPAIARLEKVNIREVFKNEPRGFTQWLIKPENIAELGRALGISLQPEKVEVPIGPFRADVVCCDGAGQKIVIENQLENSDHIHLGQIVMYAAGLGATTVVWIAPKINQQHRDTLDWLNQLSPDKFRVLGVEVGMVRISSSDPAPQFNIVSKPIAWGDKKPVKLPPPPQTQPAQRRREYWQIFLNGLKLKDYNGELPKANSLGNLRFSLGRGVWVTVYAAASIARMGVFLRVPPPVYKHIYKKRALISRELGKEAYWSPLNDHKPVVGTSENCDPVNRTDWSRQHLWLHNQLKRFLAAFGTNSNQN